MNKIIQEYIEIGAREESGIWEILIDIEKVLKLSKKDALDSLKQEINYLIQYNDIYFLKSKNLFDEKTCEILDKSILLDLELSDVEFKEEGPFYYLSFAETI